MTLWLDIVSPELRSWHQNWLRLRGPRQMPALQEYRAYAEEAPRPLSLCVAVPGAKSPPSFAFVGDKVRRLLPACRAGTSLDALPAASPGPPVSVSAPIFRVIKTREPDARRSRSTGALNQVIAYEALLLPFGDTVGGVKLIHGMVDLSLSSHTGAFR